ncbi:hypothetical protein [Phenylobacterium sp.]|uniref:hypothetical protein n=1 Tax=Phenylobacterium sp. TaxID=1871053 RepID=UPI0027302B29|nr:hypothetical protein [Phenylobacterium sp.]MDP1598474.1 hypothetical protein [Phenylobacterium sp.]MDP3591342.1 hypothetical protein [Phenylobacterium sp.]
MSEKRVSGAVARERFSAAFADRPRRSLAAEVRAQLPEIEKRLADGYGYDAVVAAFAEIGIKTDVATLHTYVYRARRGRKARAAPIAPPNVIAAIGDKTAAPAPVEPTREVESQPPSFEDAMDPKKRAERANKYLQHKPLIRPKRQ